MIHVDEVLEMMEGKRPSQIMLAQYRATYGDDFDNDEKFPGKLPFPKANKETNDKILEKYFSLFPEEKAQIGMFWVNYGFSVDETVPNNFIKRGDE